MEHAGNAIGAPSRGSLDGKVAIITGGTTGLGAAAAQLFRDEGAMVTVTGHDPVPLAQARQDFVGVSVVASDAASPTAVRALIADVGKHHGRIDILLANAGGGRFGPIEDADEALFDFHFNLNVRGPYFAIKAALPYMAIGGSIILTGSASASLGVADQSLYAATKGALRALGRTLAAEFGPRGVRVNTISVGIIPTPGHGKLGLSQEQMERLNKDYITSRTPLRRVGTPEDFAMAALFLAGPQSSYITGTEIALDGGLSNS